MDMNMSVERRLTHEYGNEYITTVSIQMHNVLMIMSR